MGEIEKKYSDFNRWLLANPILRDGWRDVAIDVHDTLEIADRICSSVLGSDVADSTVLAVYDRMLLKQYEWKSKSQDEADDE